MFVSVADIKAILDTALIYVGYKSLVSASQAENDLTAVSSGVKATQPSLQAVPLSNASLVHIFIIVPRAIVVSVSVARATSSLKNLSSPLTPQDGLNLLASLQTVEAELTAILAIHNPRVVAIEGALSGLNSWGLDTFQGLIDDLIQTFITVAPVIVPKDVLVDIQKNIDLAIEASRSNIPA